jgi:hypothetical protein
MAENHIVLNGDLLAFVRRRRGGMESDIEVYRLVDMEARLFDLDEKEKKVEVDSIINDSQSPTGMQTRSKQITKKTIPRMNI